MRRANRLSGEKLRHSAQRTLSFPTIRGREDGTLAGESRGCVVQTRIHSQEKLRR